MHIKKKFLLFSMLIALSVILCGCYDLGEAFEEDEEYRANYSEIILLDNNSVRSYYTMDDFYSDQAVNDFISPMSEEQRGEYSYILIKTENNLSLGEVAIYFDSTVEAYVSVSVFILDGDKLPTKVYVGKDGEYDLDECDEPDVSEKLASVVFHTVETPNKWKDMCLKNWSTDGTKVKRKAIEGGQYLVFRIDNNCYDHAKLMLDKAEADYQALVTAYEEKALALQQVNNDPFATAQQKEEALHSFNQSARDKNAGELVYNATKEKYESEKSPYTTKVPLRITAILINAE